MSLGQAASLLVSLRRLSLAAHGTALDVVFSARSRVSGGGGMDPLVAKHLWRALHFADPRHKGRTPHRLRGVHRWIAVHYVQRSNPGYSF